MNSRDIAKLVVQALDDKKGNNIKIIDISNVSNVCDYFIIADGSNKNQVQALSDNVQEYMHNANVELKNREGFSNGGWILLDYYDIIIHIFSFEEREFYDLEHIWRDGVVIPVEQI